MTSLVLGRLMIVVALFAMAASIGGGVAGLFLIREFDTSLGRTLDVTARGLHALDDSLVVAADTLALVDDGLGDVQQTSDEVVRALGDGAELLATTADVAENELAPSLGAVERSLPDLIGVAGAVDSALSTLSRLPIGVDYDPEQPLDESLRDIHASLAGTSDELTRLAVLVRDAGAQLDTVGSGAEGIAADLASLDTGLRDARALLSDYAATAEDAGQLLEATQADLEFRATVASTMVVALAAALALGQLAPLWFGREIVRHHEAVDRLFADSEGRGG